MSNEAIAAQIEAQRAFFAPLIIEPPDVTLTQGELGGVPVEWTQPDTGVTDPHRVVMYLHGGGYSNGLAAWARRATARLALGLGCRVVAPDYRLAPRFAFPAAHEDVLSVYQALIGEQGFAPEHIALAGDSAGGALCVSLCADARDAGLPMPACAMLNSLWADLALNTPSLDDPVRNGYDIRRGMVVQLAETLLGSGNVDPKDGRHSPVYRDLTGLPPLLIQAAGRDVCHDDSIRLAASARAAGVVVQITEYPQAEHIWILNGPWRIAYPDDYPENPRIRWVNSGAEATEAIPAMAEMVAFAKRHTRGQR
ncbi:MAG: alpha/beta hydrolase [Pseudomonadales bacterium]|nr:alpha/beta hydrolase [Pseudomonadales bacterium]